MVMQTLNETFYTKLEYHDELNPKLWNDGVLDDDVKEHLLTIAYQWLDYANIPLESIRDIVMTGGNANYNWTEWSDIDIHILCKWDEMPIQNSELMLDYLFAKKDLWKKKHNIRIKGYEVEIFAQPDDKAFPVGQGVYSLMHSKWVVKPEHENLNFDASTQLKRDIRDRLNKMRQIEKNPEAIEDAQSFVDQLRAARGESINNEGEFGHDNLIFKSLRNRGALDKFSKFINKYRDSKLSLD